MSKITMTVGITHLEGIYLSHRFTRRWYEEEKALWLREALQRKIANATARSSQNFYRAGLIRLFTGEWPIIVDVENKP